MRPALALALALGAGLAGCAGTGPLREVPGLGGVRGELRIVHERPGVPLPPAVVYLTREGRAGSLLPRGAPTVRLEDGRFEPALAAVGPDRPLRLANRGALHHRLFALAPGGRLELHLAPHERGAEIELPAAGVLRFYCSLHAEESLTVFAAPTPHFAVVDARGRYAIRGVPPGAWSLRVWTEGAHGPVRSVEVGAFGTRLEPIVLDARRLSAR